MWPFGWNGRGTVYERLAALKQARGVEEYIQEFELLIARAKPSAEDQVLVYFLARLSQDIQSLVCPHDSKELVRAMEVAHNIEDSMKQVQSFGNLQGWSTSVGFRYQGGNGAVSRLGAFGGTNNAWTFTDGTRNLQGESKMSSTPSVAKPGFLGLRNRGSRTLRYAEYVKSRDLGRCYHCGLAFGPGHRCLEKNEL